MNVQKMVRDLENPELGRTGFEIVPDDLYPQTIQFIVDTLKKQAGVGEGLRQLYNRAALLPKTAWAVALKPGAGFSPNLRKVRAEALTIARLWFTEMLHASIGHTPMHLRITKDEKWRL
jgi:hypothetical protein